MQRILFTFFSGNALIMKHVSIAAKSRLRIARGEDELAVRKSLVEYPAKPACHFPLFDIALKLGGDQLAGSRR